MPPLSCCCTPGTGCPAILFHAYIGPGIRGIEDFCCKSFRHTMYLLGVGRPAIVETDDLESCFIPFRYRFAFGQNEYKKAEAGPRPGLLPPIGKTTFLQYVHQLDTTR